MSSALRCGGSAHPSATHVCRSSVDIVRRRSRAMPPSGGRGLLHHSLRSVQGRGATTSLIPRDHVHGTNPFFSRDLVVAGRAGPSLGKTASPRGGRASRNPSAGVARRSPFAGIGHGGALSRDAGRFLRVGPSRIVGPRPEPNYPVPPPRLSPRRLSTVMGSVRGTRYPYPYRLSSSRSVRYQTPSYGLYPGSQIV